VVVGDVHSFCPDCWGQIDFLGETGCGVCGLPLEATERPLAAYA
jgi:predicted amidophosphoribosyltransferase